DLRLRNGDAALEMLLPPSPTASQRRLRVEPGHAPQFFAVGSSEQPKRGTGGEHHVHFLAQAPSERVFWIEVHTQYRSRNIELLARQGSFLSIRVCHEQMVRNGQAEVLAQVRRGTDGKNGAAAVKELAQTGNGFGHRHASLPATVFF